MENECAAGGFAPSLEMSEPRKHLVKLSVPQKQ